VIGIAALGIEQQDAPGASGVCGHEGRR
jgi:hypothetical protein